MHDDDRIAIEIARDITIAKVKNDDRTTDNRSGYEAGMYFESVYNKVNEIINKLPK